MDPQASAAQVVEIAANLDDVSGEVIGAAIDALLAAGALDAWATPITMKKGRPAVCLTLLCRPAQLDQLAQRLIELTGTFGVRLREWDRIELDRRHESVATAYGQVRIKVGSRNGKDITAKVEFDDAAKAAEAHGVPVRDVIHAAISAWQSGGAGS